MKHLVLLGMSALVGCSAVPESASIDTTGARLSLDYNGDTDVQGFFLRATRTACDASDAFEPFELTLAVDLLDGLFATSQALPGGATLEAGTRHIGTDAFMSLRGGCYDLVAIPAKSVVVATGAYTASGECSPTSVAGVRVDDGKTTEVALVSACAAVAVTPTPELNRAPRVRSTPGTVTVAECGVARVCVTVDDPDDDAIELSWQQTAGPWLHRLDADPPQVVGVLDGVRVWKACADVVPGELGTLDFKVTASDIRYEGSTTISPGGSDSGRFWVRSAFELDPQCIDAWGQLQPHGEPVARDAGCAVTPPETWYCSGDYDPWPPPPEGVCDAYGGFWPENLYPDCH